MKRALISVANKQGIEAFASELVELGFTILSTGGTASLLKKAGIAVTEVQEETLFPEMMDGRVKTLHPKIHGGILMRRDTIEDIEMAHTHGIGAIDIVCVNLYPFAATVSREHTLAEVVENIDIGGPAMVRSAAKNHAFVAVVTNPAQYAEVIGDLREHGQVSEELRRRLAVAALLHTAHYDSTISMYFWQAYGLEGFPSEMGIPMKLSAKLRYGENPHQAGAFYAEPVLPSGLATAKQLQGKELSFCNINDANAALSLVKEFTRPAAVVIKHTNPCGVAMGDTIHEAFTKAHAADPVSIFGGIVAFNGEVDEATAIALSEIFLEVIVAPGFSEGALAVLTKKKNLRLLVIDIVKGASPLPQWDLKKVEGGYLLQTPDTIGCSKNWRVVTTVQPTDRQKDDMEFAWAIVKHVNSNAIVIVKDGTTIGVGMGQTWRVSARQRLVGCSRKSRNRYGLHRRAPF